MKTLSYAEFLNNRFTETLEVLEYDTPRTKFAKPSPAEVCVPVYTGFFKERAEIDGCLRTYYIYIPTRHPASGPQLTLLCNDNMSGARLLVDTPWVDIAEEKSFVLVVLEPLDGKWNLTAAETNEMKYLEAAYQFALDRNLYSVNETGYYAAGYGNGGIIGELFAAKHCSEMSGYVSIGGRDISTETLTRLGNEPSIGDPAVKKMEVPLPIWIIEDEQSCTDSLSYWKMVNRAYQESKNDIAAVYTPDIASFGNLTNEQPVQSVWHSVIPGASQNYERAFDIAIWQFLRKVKRHAGITLNGTLRPTKTWQELGMQRFTDVISGRAREWYVYEPSWHKRHPEEKLPLVVATHGWTCSGELFMGDSEWYKVAEERDFFVVFTSAAVATMPLARHAKSLPLPAWNSYVPQPVDGVDDIGYFRSVLNHVKSNFPIDESRIYATGHSNGSMMTQCLLFQMTKEFAAYAPQGAAYNEFDTDTQLPHFHDAVKAPVWYMKGTNDVGCAADYSEKSANRILTEHFCRENGIDPEKGYVQRNNGRFLNKTYLDEKGMPCVIFSELRGYPHAYTPEVSWMLWDNFFAHIRRDKTGEIEYTL